MIEQLLPNNTKIVTQCEPLDIKHTSIGIRGGGHRGQGPPNFQQAAIRLLSYNCSAVGPVGQLTYECPVNCLGVLYIWYFTEC